MLGYENNQLVEAVDFPYDEIDGESEPESIDDTFWHLQGELLGEILRFLTVPRTLAGMGSRVATLALYLNPALIEQTSLKEIGRLHDDASSTALSKALLLLQDKFKLHKAHFQKAEHLRERFRRSAIVGHEERKLNGTNDSKTPNEVEYLRQEVRRLTDGLQAIEANAIVALKERSAKGGRAAKGKAHAKERARIAAKARWRKPR